MNFSDICILKIFSFLKEVIEFRWDHPNQEIEWQMEYAIQATVQRTAEYFG